MIPVGVVGVGSMGRHHTRVYRELPGAELIGIHDADDKRAAGVAAEQGTNAMTLPALLDAVEAVSVVVPTPYHREVAEAAADAGVSLLVEKPIAGTPQDARAILDAAEESGVTLQVGHVERFNPAVRAVAEVVPDLDVLAVTAERLGPPTERDVAANVVHDLMIHDIDVVRALLDGEPGGVTASGAASSQYATATCTFPDGVVASFTASRVTEQKVRRLAITARECRVVVDYTDQSVEIHRSTTPEYVAEDGGFRHRTESVVERPMVDNGEPLKHELRAFADAARNGTEPVVTAEDGLRALELASRIDDILDPQPAEVAT